MKRVLLINDSKFESIIIKDMLSSLYYHVDLADECDAIDEIEKFSPDYVIANLVMKQICGDQLISMIKITNPQIKCLISSNNPISIDDFHHKKVDGVIQTPVNSDVLDKALKLADQNIINKTQSNELIQLEKQGLKIRKQLDSKSEVNLTTYIEEKNICPKCNHDFDKQNINDFAFCPYCGYKL